MSRCNLTYSHARFSSKNRASACQPDNPILSRSAHLELVAKLGQIVHGAGLKFIGATLTSTKNDPVANYGTPFGLAQAAQINAFIRNSGGVFDSVADFAAATTGPDGVLLPEYATHSSGNPAPDYLHLGRAGMIAEAFTLDLNFFAGPGF